MKNAGAKEREREGGWPVERALFVDPADVGGGEILIELSAECSEVEDEEEREKSYETEGAECVSPRREIPTPEKQEASPQKEKDPGEVEAIRRRYGSRLTEAESRNEELLAFLTWSERREAIKTRELHAFQQRLHPSHPMNQEKRIKWADSTSFSSLYATPSESSAAASFGRALKEVEKGSFRDVYLHAYALRDFPSSSPPLLKREETSCCEDFSAKELPPAVYVAPPAGKSIPDALLAPSLTPESSPARFIEWISQHVDLYDDLIFPPELALAPS
ncbi:unnamed protein product [Phytomonas sp. EM1]|nr:unnamed protein product [Phytomonas sp. EM1]|eukprot:CCW64722.1 unnamed protein product [Phytomonas sp. isolate EM1]